MKRAVSGMVVVLLLLNTYLMIFSVQTANANTKSNTTGKSSMFSSVDDSRFPNEQQNPAKEGVEKQAKVVGHRITAAELEKMKQEIGVWEEGRDYNQIIGGHGTGLALPSEEEWMMIEKNAYVVDGVFSDTSTQLLSSVDNTASPWFPPIGNQGSQGSCVAWAVGYYTKTFQEAKEHGWHLSGATLDKIISPSFIYNLINDGMDHGSAYCDAIQLVCSVGACSWGKMPYNPADYARWPSEEAWREAPLYRGDENGICCMMLQSDADLANLKEWLASGNLAIVSVDANKIQDQTWGWSLLDGNDMLTLDNYVNPNPNHACTIVGYDDNFAHTEQGHTRYGAFKIANSWGTGGGWEHILDGCYWISYEAMKQSVGYCMFYHDRVDYAPELVAGFRISHDKRGECDITVGIGNVTDPIVTKSFSDYVHGGSKPFCQNQILFDITEFKDAIPNVSSKTFFLEVSDWGSSTTGVITDFKIEGVQSRDTPIYTINGNSVFVNVTMPPLWTSLRGVYCERAYGKLDSGISWFRVNDSTSWSGLVMEASSSSSNYGWIYGPYITTGWDGESMLGKPFTVVFRLKSSYNVGSDVVAVVDVAYNLGVVLQSRMIRADEFVSADAWQDFQLTFIVPSSVRTGLEFRVQNRNNGFTDLFVDYMCVGRSSKLDFVVDCYRDLFFRDPEPEGLEFWESELESGGLTRVSFAETIFNSQEYQGKWKNRLFVALMYDGILERGPDQGGYNYYVTALDSSSTTWNAMLDNWLKSAEWKVRFGNLNDTEFVRKMYRGMLHREPDQEGLNFWTMKLTMHELTRPELIISLFTESLEYRIVNAGEKLVYQLYLGLLGRVPDPEGYKNWVSIFNSGTSGQDLIQAFLTCSEYYAKHS